MFEIVRIEPVFSPITDGCIGSRAERLPMAYQSKAFAEKLAGLLGRAEAENCGDATFKVVPVGAAAFTGRLAA